MWINMWQGTNVVQYTLCHSIENNGVDWIYFYFEKKNYRFIGIDLYLFQLYILIFVV